MLLAKIRALHSALGSSLRPSPPSVQFKAPIGARNLSNWGKMTPEKFRLRDKMPEGYELIYRCTMHLYLAVTQTVTTATAAVFAVAVALGASSEGLVLQPTKSLSLEIKGSRLEFAIFAAGFVGLGVATRRFISKCPIRIYYNPAEKKYTALFYTVLPPLTKRLHFSAGHVAKTPPSGLLPWRDSRYRIRNVYSALLMEHYFRRPLDMNVMLGYQKET